MRRHAWLIVAFAALFGLRAPLCAYACLESGPPQELATAAEPEHSPCHGGSTDTPTAPESSDHECDCDRIQLIVQQGDAKKAFESYEIPMPPLAVASLSLPDVSQAPTALWRRHDALPPPDILLLHSTLLL